MSEEIKQEEVKVDPDETTGELWTRLSSIGARLLRESVEKIDNGTASRTKQPEEYTLAPMLSKELCPVDFTKPAKDVHNLIRGLYPWPVATTKINGKTYKIHKSQKISEKFNGISGEVVDNNNRLVIVCGDGKAIEILELIYAEDVKPLMGDMKPEEVDFLLGYGSSNGLNNAYLTYLDYKADYEQILKDKAAALEKIKECKASGKRNFIVIVSEGLGGEYAPALAKKIEEETGVETKFARLAHIVRGGSPTLRDRLTATKMGFAAVELLLDGKSDRVVIEDKGEIKDMDIVFALTVDRMYKGKLKDGDLDNFTAEEIAEMERICKERRTEIEHLYKMSYDICR